MSETSFSPVSSVYNPESRNQSEKLGSTINLEIVDGLLSEARIMISGSLRIDYQKYKNGASILECFVFDLPLNFYNRGTENYDGATDTEYSIKYKQHLLKANCNVPTLEEIAETVFSNLTEEQISDALTDVLITG